MKALRIVLGAAVWSVAAAAGLWLVCAAVAPEGCNLWAWIVHRPERAMLAGILVAGVAVLWAMSLATRAPGEEELRFAGDGGDVRIRLSAIRDYILRIAPQVTGLEASRCRVGLAGNRLRIVLQCRMPPGRSAIGAARALQERVRSALREDLGIEEVDAIEVQVVAFAEPPAAGRSGPGRITVDGPPSLA